MSGLSRREGGSTRTMVRGRPAFFVALQRFRGQPGCLGSPTCSRNDARQRESVRVERMAEPTRRSWSGRAPHGGVEPDLPPDPLGCLPGGPNRYGWLRLTTVPVINPTTDAYPQPAGSYRRWRVAGRSTTSANSLQPRARPRRLARRPVPTTVLLDRPLPPTCYDYGRAVDRAYALPVQRPGPVLALAATLASNLRTYRTPNDEIGPQASGMNPRLGGLSVSSMHA